MIGYLACYVGNEIKLRFVLCFIVFRVVTGWAEDICVIKRKKMDVRGERIVAMVANLCWKIFRPWDFLLEKRD